ncbi:AAA family ATPase (plasmid) [Pandoraea faecigallinarum]|uniref:AAA family ATPase n=1 Tax=Pandoraea faecigallinarum TaxID=656179 RepID=A0A0H3X3K5_9BURK|nr:MobF family relaxase [Pandoraea faecigallinarum]AKM33518.1 AAA family ATPase [Pandoraea faecigallinarum]
MLNVTPIRGNNQYAAAHYFAAADDYYAKEHPGEWQGEGAQLLGLTGPIEQAQFSRLLDGRLPNGERIQTTFDTTAHKKRMGLDLTFSAPKSVSMQALVAGDREVSAAHDRAVTRALEQVERLAEARKKTKGKSCRERTGNMVIGKFRHEMSRAKDPQLHTHAVVLNMTRRADGAWRALSNEDIFRAYDGIDALYKAELARGMQALGYAIRVVDDKGNFELAHISREQIEAFSARSRVIEQALADEGKTRTSASTLEKQVIALATRPRKDESDRQIVKQYWIEKSRELGIDYGARSPLDGHSEGPRSALDRAAAMSLPVGLTPAQAVVQYAINHLTEREAVVRESALTATALRRAVGLAGIEEVCAEIRRLVEQGALIEAVPAYRTTRSMDGPALSPAGWASFLSEREGLTQQEARAYVSQAIQRGSLVAAETLYTTHKALAREKAILAIERSGRAALAPIMTAVAVKAALEGFPLNADQRLAVETIIATPHRFVGNQGDAGTGKTYTVNQAVALIRQAAAGNGGESGYRTVALAPYGNQVTALRNAGLDAHTLASFLRAKDKSIDARTIVVLDEAGVVGARQMEQLMRAVEQAGARMVMIGDTKQTEAIEAGKPFAQLQQGGMPTTRISEITRQEDRALKTAVEHAAEGRVTQSLAHLSHVEEFKEPSERHRAIVADYIALTEAERRDTLIVAGTNDARREINRMVRESLALTGNGREFETLTRVDMTQAQRRFAPSYQPGMVIQPERDYQKAGLTRGETYRVREALPGNILRLQRPDGTTAAINPRRATQLSVYQLERAELSVGDTVRINRNDPGRDLTNGDRLRVVGVAGGAVTLESLESIEPREGRPVRSLELPSTRPLHLEHAYASTVHSAQGLTSERALIALDTRSRTTSMNLYYVAISRARQEARVYTNSLGELPDAIARRFDKSTALALQRERQVLRREAGLPPKGAADGKPALSRPPREPHELHEPQRRAPASGKESSGYERFD